MSLKMFIKGFWIPFITAVCLFCGWKSYEIQKGCDVEVTSVPVQIIKEQSQTIEYCLGERSKECVRPLINFKTRYRIAKKYNLLGCAIEKNFSTMLTAILCYLHNEKRFLKSGRKLTDEMFHRRFCGPRNELTLLSNITDKFKVVTEKDWKEWNLIAIVRDPYQRFVSGFTDKCRKELIYKQFPSRCNFCQQNLTCFMEKQYARMMKKSNKEPIKASFDDDHFHPQSWRCEFYSHLYSYRILKYDSDHPQQFLKELYIELQRKNVSVEAIEFIDKQLTSGRTPHSTVSSPERDDVIKELTSSPYLMELLIKMYYYDFVLFGFPLPTIPLGEGGSGGMKER